MERKHLDFFWPIHLGSEAKWLGLSFGLQKDGNTSCLDFEKPPIRAVAECRLVKGTLLGCATGNAPEGPSFSFGGARIWGDFPFSSIGKRCSGAYDCWREGKLENICTWFSTGFTRSMMDSWGGFRVKFRWMRFVFRFFFSFFES